MKIEVGKLTLEKMVEIISKYGITHTENDLFYDGIKIGSYYYLNKDERCTVILLKDGFCIDTTFALSAYCLDLVKEFKNYKVEENLYEITKDFI